MREFNISLLGKWCWMMLVDREGLWYSMLVTRYGQNGGMLREGVRRYSNWWREVLRVRDGGGGGLFKESISKKVGDGMVTFFWTDPWVGGVLLAVPFRRLYDLSVNKNCLMGEMFVLGVEEGERLGSGVGGCGIGRRTWFGSIGYRCLILFYKFRLRPMELAP
ncbi:hypothetical protein MtrunA17_Chr2g0314641 [Medicago truncatula]|uniref:Uncharacterized protein n=1 Tax=Medicago truncatula TaxID=3880 RepID=A0A396JID8_MEDTR|nr:hypothetical protein MtrunA17_Chr2g0314641 [Medicago truncatula]